MDASFPTSTLAAARTTSSHWRSYGMISKVGLSALAETRSLSLCTPTFTTFSLDEAYTQCGRVCKDYAKTFYLGTLIMTPERRRAIWAIYVWCRRTDDLVDGPNASYVKHTDLDCWESRLLRIFQNRPFDMFDAALADTVNKFSINIQPFKDMMEGMKMDIKKSRYENFDELYEYCYRVAGTVGLMSIPVMGTTNQAYGPTESILEAAVAMGIANQLTNILRDVGEDAKIGRIYLPQDELREAGLSDKDVFGSKVTDKWRIFMMNQINRTRAFYEKAEIGIQELSSSSRWPVWATLLMYRQILDAIEDNDYNNFTRRAYVNRRRKMFTLPITLAKTFLMSH